MKKKLFLFLLLALPLAISSKISFAQINTYTLPYIDRNGFPNIDPYRFDPYQKISYKNGCLYYITQKNYNDRYILYEFNGNTETAIKAIDSNNFSAPAVNYKGDIFFITLENNSIILNCVNKNGSREWSHHIDGYCEGEYSYHRQIFSPIIIDDFNLFVQSNCGNIFIYSSEGANVYHNKIDSNLTRSPYEIDNKKIVTGNRIKIFVIDISQYKYSSGDNDVGIIPQDPPSPSKSPEIIPQDH